ncbi:peptide chain release factor N(5)-glutamine methyltransferase [Nocardia camponoti]|uniref:Release factor glutamine methyltransferase n=1 Tax=Nocardia camponoti TaxID=1616106 RepID=A0A917QL01_9NOCA|nr:peptide chain release factor N(5)-glutamine methyltransferase [Nocardia camponoti]GGK55904.1 release factor glutamine methyltransferase [Nocardia camponoti]
MVAEQIRLRPLIVAAGERLSAAGVASPLLDAELLAAHVLGVSRMRLALEPTVDAAFVDPFDALVAQREQRIPLQHLTGTAPLGAIDLAVGPGVFIPRPETELLVEWAVRSLDGVKAPIVVDLCAGSGAIALAIAHARPDAEVHAVELDPAALEWTRSNAKDRAAQGDTPIAVHAADVTDPALLSELTGRVDLVVSNPPYIPEAATLEPEVAQHDPHRALFGGPDGLSVINRMVPNIARLVRAGGATGIEHDDTNGAGVADALTTADFTEVARHNDLANKPRFVTARRR